MLCVFIMHIYFVHEHLQVHLVKRNKLVIVKTEL